MNKIVVFFLTLIFQISAYSMEQLPVIRFQRSSTTPGDVLPLTVGKKRRLTLSIDPSKPFVEEINRHLNDKNQKEMFCSGNLFEKGCEADKVTLNMVKMVLFAREIHSLPEEIMSDALGQKTLLDLKRDLENGFISALEREFEAEQEVKKLNEVPERNEFSLSSAHTLKMRYMAFVPPFTPEQKQQILQEQTQGDIFKLYETPMVTDFSIPLPGFASESEKFNFTISYSINEK